MREKGNLLLEILLVMAVLIVAIPFLMQKEFKRKESGQNQAIAHRIRQLGAVSLSYMRDQPDLNDGLTVLEGNSLLNILKPYGLSKYFETIDRFSQNYEVHIKQETDSNNHKVLSGFIVVYLSSGLSENLSFLRRRKMAESIGAMGAILEENGEITSSSGLWEMTQEEWGYSLPPFAILMALQENDVSYTFLSRFKIDDLGQGNTFLVDLNMGENNIENANTVYVKTVETKNIGGGSSSLDNLAVIESMEIPNAKFDSITVETIAGTTATAFLVSGDLTANKAEAKQLYLSEGITEELDFTQGNFVLSLAGIEDEIGELKVTNDFTFVSDTCVEYDPIENNCENHEDACCLDDVGNILMAPQELDWNYVSAPLTINSAVKGLNDTTIIFSATAEIQGDLYTSKIYFGETETNEYPYVLNFSNTQTFVEDLKLNTGDFSTDLGNEKLLLEITKFVYGGIKTGENTDGLYLKFLNLLIESQEDE